MKKLSFPLVFGFILGMITACATRADNSSNSQPQEVIVETASLSQNDSTSFVKPEELKEENDSEQE